MLLCNCINKMENQHKIWKVCNKFNNNSSISKCFSRSNSFNNFTFNKCSLEGVEVILVTHLCKCLCSMQLTRHSCSNCSRCMEVNHSNNYRRKLIMARNSRKANKTQLIIKISKQRRYSKFICSRCKLSNYCSSKCMLISFTCLILKCKCL